MNNESAAPVLTPTPTDLSRHLRYIAKVTPDGAMPQLAVKTVLAVADEIERYYGGMMAWKRTAESQDVASVAQDREKFSTMQGMADCMDMVRTDLIEMGIIDKTVAPMFIPEAIARYLKSPATGAQEQAGAGNAGSDGQREKVRDALSATLGDAMDCTRTWKAWGVGTMTEDDFELLADNDERLEELVDAVSAAISGQGKGSEE